MNQFLLYGGLVLTALALSGIIIYLIAYRLRLSKLNKILDQEYGSENQ